VPHQNKKYRLIFIGAWLMAKLIWTVELSRLAIFRWFPTARVQYMIPRKDNFVQTKWLYIAPNLYALSVDESENQIVIKRVTEIVKN